MVPVLGIGTNTRLASSTCNNHVGTTTLRTVIQYCVLALMPWLSSQLVLRKSVL